MSEMIERMAKALFEADQKLSPNTDIMNRLLYGKPAVTWEYINDHTCVIPSIANEYRSKAKSLLAVIREPTKAMIKAVDEGCYGYGDDSWEWAWQTMIDAAIKE